METEFVSNDVKQALTWYQKFFEVIKENQGRLIASAVVIAIILVVWFIFKKIYTRHFKENGKNSFTHIVFGIVRFVVILGTILIVLQINGVNVTSAVAGLGIVSAIVGLALQDILKDVIMGIHIISDKFFAVGDGVEYGGKEGIVIAFSMKTTKIRVLEDGSEISVCNRNISEIRKLSHLVDIDVPLSYEENTEKVHKTLSSLCNEIAGIEGIESCIYKGTQAFEESDILYKVRFFCAPENKLELRRAALKIIQEGLEKENINIPFNQIDVHIEQK